MVICWSRSAAAIRFHSGSVVALPLFHVPLTKTVFGLLDLADSTYARAALLKLLTSAYLRPEGTWPR